MGNSTMAATPPLPPDDPPPVPPEPIGTDACCRGGCDRCVLDLYEEEMARYRAALAAWESRRKAT